MPSRTIDPSSSIGPRLFSFQHGDLLSEGEDFEGSIPSTAKEDSDRHKEREDDLEHESILLTRPPSRTFAGPTMRNHKLLISNHHGLLSTDRELLLASMCIALL